METNVLNTSMTSSERFAVENEVNNFNKKNTVNGHTASQSLGKDDFLKLLITQLSNQDPTNPMEDTEFISQMAQFSSLEQITNMNESFSKMAAMINSSQGMNLLGRTVDMDIGDATTQGVVEAATMGEKPQVMVNGMYYDLERIKNIYN
ncbi:MAG: flagellar hook assembly protein FlgD [Treponema sp.]|nr:flagellar hook assembly protein FlgD [Treponema sp.]